MKEFSEKEKDLLRHKDFINELLAKRLKQGKEVKSWWQVFLNSIGGTALITVLLGGVLTQMITCSVQNKGRETEFRQALAKLTGEQALITYRENLHQEIETLKTASELIGDCISASVDLVDLNTKKLALASYEGEDRKKVSKQRDDIRTRYNKLDSEWAKTKVKVGLLMGYYHPRHPKVSTSWNDIEDSLTGYMNCAQAWYLENYGKELEDTQSVCSDKRDTLFKNLDVFTKNLGAARQNSLEWLETTEKLSREAAKPSNK